MERIKLGIRGRVTAGFLILVAMVIVSGALSIHELKRMSLEVRSMMQDSYQSVLYSQGMLEAQDEENEVLLRYIADDFQSRKEAELAFAQWHAEFSRCQAQAHDNITHEGERALLESIDSVCVVYVRAAQRVLQADSLTIKDYVKLVNPAHRDVKKAVQQLLELNQGKLFKASDMIASFPERAVRPGVIVVVVGVMFALMFIYLFSTFYVRPVVRMRDAAEGYLRYRDRIPVKFSTGDELEELWRAIERLMDRCDEEEGRHRGI